MAILTRDLGTTIRTVTDIRDASSKQPLLEGAQRTSSSTANLSRTLRTQTPEPVDGFATVMGSPIVTEHPTELLADVGSTVKTPRVRLDGTVTYSNH